MATIGPMVEGGVALSGHTDVRAGRRSEVDERPVRVARGRRPPLRTRRLRHEGLRRRRAGDGSRIPRRGLEAADPFAAQLRRGDELPRLARSHRPLRPRDAAPGAGDRRRADDDDRRRFPQGRRDFSHPRDGVRGAFVQAGARRQRGDDRRRRGQRDRPAGARLRSAGDLRSPFRSALFDAAGRRDPRRNGAQHPRPRMRLPLEFRGLPAFLRPRRSPRSRPSSIRSRCRA